VPAPTRSTSDLATRNDAITGVREEVAYLGPEGDVLGFTYVPDGVVRGGVVLCPSLHAEFLGNYRKEVLLARDLAAAGLAVQRFHHRGEGNSLGAPEDVTFERLCADATVAGDRLRERTGVDQLAFLGTRLGALVAAATSSGPLVLWEPVLDARTYFREAFRARRMRELKDGVAEPSSAPSLEAQLSDEGSVDVLGYTIHRSLFESLRPQHLAIGDVPRPVLIVQIAKRAELRREYTAAAEAWRSAGCPVDTAVVDDDESWWFVGEDWQPEERRSGTATLVAETRRWLLGHYGGTAA
jgi:hypothetical protein